MNYNNSIKSFAFLLLVSSFFINSCRKTPDPLPERETAIGLVTPADGSTLTFLQDENLEKDHIQTTITARIGGIESGNKISLKNKAPGSVLSKATLYNGVVEFPDYTLASGRNELTIFYEGTSANFTVFADENSTFCRLARPQPGYTITEDSNSEMPYLQQDITVVCQGDDAASEQAVYLSVNDKIIKNNTIEASGKATYHDVTLIEGENILLYGLRENLPSLGQEDCLNHQELCTILNVDTGKCRLKINLSESNTYLARDDTNSDLAGLQIAVTVETNCSPAADIVLNVADSLTDLENGKVISYREALSTVQGKMRLYTFKDVSLTYAGENDLVTRYIQAVVNDEQKSSSIPLALLADGQAPVFSDLSPAHGAYINDNILNFSATLSGIEAGTEVTLEVRRKESHITENSLSTFTSENSTVSATLNLADGAYVLTVSAKDAAGNIAQKAIEFYIDSIAPIFSLASPLDSALFESALHPELLPNDEGLAIPVVVSIDPRQSGEFVGSKLTIDLLTNPQGGTLTPVAQKELINNGDILNFDFGKMIFPFGRYQLKVIATDEAGNQSAEIIELKIDSFSHNITIFNGGGSCAAGDNLVISGAIDPVSKSISSYNCHLWSKAAEATAFSKNPLAVNPSSSDGALSFSAEAVGNLATGQNDIYVTCENDSGYVAVSKTIRIFIDNTPPTIAGSARFIAPQDGALLGQSSIDTNSDEEGLQQNVTLEMPIDTTEPNLYNMSVELISSFTGGEELFRATLPLGDGGSLTFYDVTVLPAEATEGQTVLNAYLLDCAGNRSNPLSITLNANTKAPVIRQAQPDPTRSEFGVQDDVTMTTDDIALKFSYRVQGDINNDIGYLSFEPPLNVPDMDPVLVALPKAIGNGIFEYAFNDVPFDGGSYTALFVVSDSFGNKSELSYSFSINTELNAISITAPAINAKFNAATDLKKNIPGYQTEFTAIAFGYPKGSPAYLCSSLKGTASELCPVGSGYVLATSTNNGSLRRSTVFFTDATLPEGSQEIYVAIENSDLNISTASDMRSIIVDTEPPELKKFEFINNKTQNDTENLLVFNSTLKEGIAGASGFAVSAAAEVSGLSQKTMLRVYSDNPSPNSLVGSTSVSNDVQSKLTLNLAEGTHHLQVVVEDENGNKNAINELSSYTVYVDSSLPSVELSTPAKSLYTAQDGTIATYEGQKVLMMPVQVIISDGSALNGSKVVLSRTSGSDVAQIERTLTASGKEAILTFDVPFLQKDTLNETINTISVSMTDIGQNEVHSAVTEYHIDYLGPTANLVLEQNGTSLNCQASGSCTANIVTGGDNRPLGYGYLDTSSNDLLVNVAGCPCTLSLISEMDGITDIVFNSSLDSAADLDTAYSNLATAIAGIGPGFLPGDERTVKLKATDASGNITYSNPLYLTLHNVSSALILVERTDKETNEPLTGLLVEEGSYFGNLDGTPAGDFLNTALTIAVDNLDGSDLSGANVTLSIESPAGKREVSGTVSSNNTVLISGVNLELSQETAIYNSLDISLTKGGSLIGHRIINGLVADVDAPTITWRRVGNDILGGLKEFNVPYNESGINGEALWNASLDWLRGDGIHENGLNTSRTALVAEVSNIEENQLVTISTDQPDYPLSGAATRTTACDNNHHCLAIFTNLGVPSLPAGEKHSLSLSATDKAGNISAKAVAETIIALVDTMPPAPIKPLICLGESTNPPDDNSAKYLEPDICSSICKEETCSRRHGHVTIAWQSENSAIANDITMYKVGYRPLGYSALGYLAACADLSGTLDESNISHLESLSLSADENGTISYTFKNLPLHQDYCFVVEALDSAQNSSETGDSNGQRVLPLRTWPEDSHLDGTQSEGRDNTSPAYLSSRDNMASYGSAMVNVGDIDNDGRDDFAVAAMRYLNGKGAVDLFLSGAQDIANGGEPAPSYTFNLTENTPGSPYLGYSIAAAPLSGAHKGDLTGDDHADLVISSNSMPNINNGAIANGAVFVYSGYDLASNFTGKQVANVYQPNYEPQTAFYYDSPAAAAAFGVSTAIADLNGDGQGDLIIGSNTGKAVFIYYGGSNFPTGDVIITTDGSGEKQPDVTITAEGNYGFLVAAGDFNGDGKADLVTTNADRKALHIYHGPLTEKNYTPAQAIREITVGTMVTNLVTLPGTMSGKQADSLLLSYNGTVQLYCGSENGLLADPCATLSGKDFAAATLTSFGQYSGSLALLGDIDGDNRVEIAVGAPTVATVMIADIDLLDSAPAFKIDSFLYGSTASTNQAFAFGRTIVNINNFMGDALGAFIVSEAINGNGALHLYW